MMIEINPCQACKGKRYIGNTVCLACEGTGDQRVVKAKKSKLEKYYASEKRDRIIRRLKFFLAFVGLIIVGVILRIQVINEWDSHPVVLVIESIYILIIILLAFYSLWRAVKGE